jgi:hypothetical protein
LNPSIATVPSRASPAARHNRNTCANSPRNASWWIWRNREITVWSGASCAQITRNPTSVSHNRSICRLERCPHAYA